MKPIQPDLRDWHSCPYDMGPLMRRRKKYTALDVLAIIAFTAMIVWSAYMGMLD